MMDLRNIPIKSKVFDIAVYAEQGDIGSIIAHQKLIEVRNVISFANIAVEKATKETDNISKYIAYRSAILDYNSCFDYILQIIYFGFDFCSRVDSRDDYINQLKSCKLEITSQESGDKKVIKSPFWYKIEELKRTNSEAKQFFKNFKKFRRKLRESDIDISEWANNIKHQGGFVVEEVLDKEKLARIMIKDRNNKDTLFDLSYIYLSTTFAEIERRLCKQNKIIVDFLNDLQDTIVGNPQKIFSANGYNKEELKGIVHLTNFEINNNELQYGAKQTK